MLLRLFKYSIKNIFRNLFLSISSILVLSLLMFFINVIILIHNISFQLIDNVNSKMSISLYLDSSYSNNDSDVIDLINELKEVSKDTIIEYKNKEKVLEEIKQEDPELVRILQDENPLPNTITISNVALNNYDLINNIISKRKYLFSSNILKNDKNDKNDRINSRVATYDQQFEKITWVISILKALALGLYFIIWVFIFSIAIIIYSVIWNFIYFFRNEIYITKLVWGSNIFIYGPFSLQWMIYSIISFFLSLIVFIFIVLNTRLFFKNTFSLDFLLNFNFTILAVELLLFIIIGWISWFFSSKKYLNTNEQ